MVTSLFRKRWNRFILTSRLWSLRPGSPQFQVNWVLLAMESRKQTSGGSWAQYIFLFPSLCLWWSAEPGNARSERCRKILDVTILLLSAVSIATSRVTFPRHADLYLQHMQGYLTGLKELFPDFKFVPNQHMALHLRDYILLYGPVHSWWAFPFERMIGTLQQIIKKVRPLVKCNLRD